MRKIIISSLLASTFLVNTVQASEIYISPLPVNVVNELQEKSISNAVFLERVKNYLVQYPEQTYIIENIVRNTRPVLLSEVRLFIAENNLHKTLGETVQGKIIKTPKTVVGVEKATGDGLGFVGLGALAAGVAAFALSGGKSPTPTPTPPVTTPQNPSDFVTPEFESSYALGLIGMHNFYANEQASGEGVKVAVVDTGVDMTHPDLIDNIDSVNSYSYRSSNGSVQDFNGHGTHVAGIIAGMKNDSGVHGISYNSEIVAYEFLIDSGNGDGLSTIPSIGNLLGRLEDSGIRVVNNSWSYVKQDPNDPAGNVELYVDDFNTQDEFFNFIGMDSLMALESYLTNVDGVIIVSNGNDGHDEVSALAGLPYWVSEAQSNWLAVGAVDENKQIADFSNRCGVAAEWCLVAPGVGITSTFSRDAVDLPAEYATLNGTSMAAPFVSGAIALGMELFPEATAQEIITILFDTAEDLGDPGTDAVYGRGMLRLGEALSPQGTMSIEMTDSVMGEKMRVDNSGFVASRFIGNSLKEVADNYSISVTDKYNRGFDANLGNFVSTNSIAPSRNHEISYKVNNFTNDKSSENVIMDTGDVQVSLGSNVFASGMSASVKFGDGGYNTILSVNNTGDYGTYSDTGFVSDSGFGVAHLGLINNSDINAQHSIRLSDFVSVQAKYVFGDTVIGEQNSDASSGMLGVGFNLNTNSSLNVNLGNVSEKGSVLGGIGFGAFDTTSTKTRTDFIQFGGDFGVSDSSSFLFSASLGKSSFDSAGLINGGHLNTESYSIGYKKNGVLSGDDSLVFGVSQPLTVTSGKVSMDVPVGRAASVGGMSSSSVLREDVDMSIDGKRLTQLEIGYNKKIDKDTSFSFGTIYSQELGSTASMRFSLKF